MIEISKNTTSKLSAFTLRPFAENKRIQEIVISRKAIESFRKNVLSRWDVQAIQYKPFLRFAVADLLNQSCHNLLGSTLLDIITDRERAAFLVSYEKSPTSNKDTQQDFDILFSTAISHLIGLPNHDAMYGSFYARFVVEHNDDSDSYLRQAYHRLELHNDGTYVDERTDFVLMMKMDEQNMQGGETVLLHIDDWKDRDIFYKHPLAKQSIPWGSPKSKNVVNKVYHPIFFEEDKNGKPHMLFIDQFAEPQNMQQGLYLFEMGESLETDNNATLFDLPVGSMIVIQNHCWLHGREKFQAHPKLRRELLRLRGHFTA